MTLKTRLSVLFISTPVLAFVVVGGLMGKEPSGSDQTYQHLRVFEDVVALVLGSYVEPVKVDRVMEGAMRGPGRRPRSRQRVPERQAGPGASKQAKRCPTVTSGSS